MKRPAVLLFLILFTISLDAFSFIPANITKILVEIPDGKLDDADIIAIQRIREYSNAIVHVESSPVKQGNRASYPLTIVLGTTGDSPELTREWQNHLSPKEDSYVVRSISENPLVILVSGQNERGILYAAYQLADQIKAGSDLSKLDMFFQPKITQRYVSFGATTHGRKHYRPALYYQTLKELPRYGYNGVLIYPGGGTPIGRRSSPVAEAEDGALYRDSANTRTWKKWFAELKEYKHDIVMTIPPMVPPGYSNKEIKDYYKGGAEPKGYIANLKTHYKQFLEILTRDYPEIDSYLFNSTEGATFGRNERFFGHPDHDRFPNKQYLANNERIMKAYFDVLSDFFKEDIDKVSFWTHSFGLTSDGIAKMREVLFQYPKVLILEDDYWNNNLWPFDIPAMKYLPTSLRAEISTKNPFGMFQIATDGEYYGGGSLPNVYAGSHINSARDAIKRDARMVIQRLDLHDRFPYGTLFGTMEIVPIAASKQLWDPVPDETAVWKEWAVRRFGRDAAPLVINALKESKTILLNGLSCNGIDLLGVGSEFIPRLWVVDNSGLSRFYLFAKPGKKFVDKTEKDVVFSEEYTAFQMNTHSIPIKEYRNNQNSALEAVDRGLKEIEKARPYLTAADYRMLNDIFVNGQHVLEALRLLGEAAYATNITLSNFDNVGDPASLFKRSISDMENFIRDQKVIPEMNKNLIVIVNNYKTVGTNALSNAAKVK